jgi:mono/diheme cytochrome c family protein
MNDENPEIQPKPPVPTDEALQPGAPDFVETPEVDVASSTDEPLPIWLFLVCGFALFMAGSSFAGFGTFGLGLYDQGPGATPVANSNQPTAVVSTDPMVLGKKVYGSYCASCHQAAGTGQPGKYPPLAGSEWVLGSKERMAAIILHGLSGPVTVCGSSYGTDQMAPWSAVLSDDKIAQVMTYIRGSWSNTADPVTSDEVTAARTKFNSQSAPYSEADLLKIAPNTAAAK